MQPSSLASRLKRCASVRDWLWWQLPPPLRFYVGAVTAVTLVVIGVAAAFTVWTADDAAKFFLLVCCGVVSVAFTPRAMFQFPGLTRDFSTVWVIPIAILLPPVYAALAPIPIIATLHFYVHRGVAHRRVFTAASISLTYAAASVIFRWFPQSFAGHHIGTSWHALTWALAVAACEVLAGRGQNFLIIGAVKIADRKTRMLEIALSTQGMETDFAKVYLGVLITLAVGVSPALVCVAFPLVFLVRRFLEHPILVAQSRMDAKTGLLNVSTWEKEAEAEISRAARLRQHVAMVLVDIDLFKNVNDTYGHLVGDRVLKAVAETLTSQSRDYDRVGRFGGEEFVLLLAQTTEGDACKIAERLRGNVADLAIPVDDRPDAPTLQVTISIGVTSLARGESFELTDLLAAADSAMYAAKQAGRNRVAFAPPLRDMGLEAAWHAAPGAGADRDGSQPSVPSPAAPHLGGNPLSTHRVVLVQAEQATASLCPRR
jgi:diguanylate cyclase (GGDEF)-like protein